MRVSRKEVRKGCVWVKNKGETDKTGRSAGPVIVVGSRVESGQMHMVSPQEKGNTHTHTHTHTHLSLIHI